MTGQLAAQTLGKWAATLTFDGVPPDVRHQVKRCLLDLSGVALAGTATDPSRRAREYVKKSYAAGPCTVFGEAGGVQAAGAAFANAVSGHVLDFDDTCYAGIVHGSVVVGPAVLAAAQLAERGGPDLTTAFVAGVEVEYALGHAVTGSLYMKGWWNSAVLGTFGAAAGAARALSLDPDQTTNAIAMAACQVAGAKVSFGTDTKPLIAGAAAETGLRAALLAKSGASAPADAFEEGRGFINLYNDGIFDHAALGALGENYGLLDPGIAFKPYPSCSAGHAAIEAVSRLLDDYQLAAKDVERIRCQVPELVDISLTYPEPRNVSEAQFSLPFAVGCILAFGEFSPAQLNDATLCDPAFGAEMTKVELVRAEEDVIPANSGAYCPEWALVEITSVSGQTYERFVGAAKGAPEAPMSDQDLERKFLSCAEFKGAGVAVAAWPERFWGLENISDVRNLYAKD